jgi:hypothetical protein
LEATNMPKVTNQTAQQVQNHCGPDDKTAPPTPGIVRSMAFDKAKDGSTVHTRDRSGGRAPGTRDPAYIELNNVEIGTHIELINLSANPGAEFDDKDTIKLELTGRDPKSRTASIYLKQTQLDKLGLKPGDMYQLRAVDNAGNTSAPVSAELQGNEWANGRVLENNTWQGQGAQINALDGESQRKSIVAKAVNDTRPPMVLEDGVSILTKGNGQKSMVFDKAIEPGATLRVLNSRTGQAFAGTIPANQQLEIALKGVEDGDPLLVSVTDNNGVAGKDLEIVYSKACKDGKAPKLQGGMSTRFPGVI